MTPNEQSGRAGEADDRRVTRWTFVIGLPLLLVGAFAGWQLGRQWPAVPAPAMAKSRAKIEFLQRWERVVDEARAESDRLQQDGQTGRALALKAQIAAASNMARQYGPASQKTARHAPSAAERAAMMQMQAADDDERMADAYRTMLMYKYPKWDPEQ